MRVVSALLFLALAFAVESKELKFALSGESLVLTSKDYPVSLLFSSPFHLV
jgi:hypothetical protein